jgi:hypothetical protein
MFIRELDFEYKLLKCHVIIMDRTPSWIQLSFRNPDPNIDQAFSSSLPFEYDTSMTDEVIVGILANREDFQYLYENTYRSFELNYSV